MSVAAKDEPEPGKAERCGKIRVMGDQNRSPGVPEGGKAGYAGQVIGSSGNFYLSRTPLQRSLFVLQKSHLRPLRKCPGADVGAVSPVMISKNSDYPIRRVYRRKQDKKTVENVRCQIAMGDG